MITSAMTHFQIRSYSKVLWVRISIILFCGDTIQPVTEGFKKPSLIFLSSHHPDDNMSIAISFSSVGRILVLKLKPTLNVLTKYGMSFASI